MAQARKDDLNLSLTGSQMSAISIRSSSGRPGSGQAKKAFSLVDVRQNKVCCIICHLLCSSNVAAYH